MATTDQCCAVQRPLAEFSYRLKEKSHPELLRGQTFNNFMDAYDSGEIQLSTVFENLLAATRTKLGKPTQKVSEHGRDFDNNGDMKTGVLCKNGDKRRYVVASVFGKIGTIYFVGWNWITNEPNFFALPRPEKGFPKSGIKIPVHPITGERTGGKYNDHAYGTWEEMCMVG